jgi:hypothetical protein
MDANDIVGHSEIISSFEGQGRYKIVFANTRAHDIAPENVGLLLQEAVNDMAAEGWRICGGLAVLPRQDGSHDLYAVLEKEDE